MNFLIPCIVGAVIVVMMIKYLVKNMIRRFIITTIISVVTGAVGLQYLESKRSTVVKKVEVVKVHDAVQK